LRNIYRSNCYQTKTITAHHPPTSYVHGLLCNIDVVFTYEICLTKELFWWK